MYCSIQPKSCTFKMLSLTKGLYSILSKSVSYEKEGLIHNFVNGSIHLSNVQLCTKILRSLRDLSQCPIVFLRMSVEPNCDLAEEARDEGMEAFAGRDLTGTNLMDDFAVISQEHNDHFSAQVGIFPKKGGWGRKKRKLAQAHTHARVRYQRPTDLF